jgi:predicted ATPase
MVYSVDKLTIEGFKSIRKLERFELRPLNVLIGANGTGKSNFLEFFRFLRELIQQRLQLEVARAGGADAYLHLGPKVTKQIAAELRFGDLGYRFTLVPAVGGRLIFADEAVADLQHGSWASLGSGHSETRIKETDVFAWGFLHNAALTWLAYHFHDTSTTAGARRPGAINVNEYLQPDGSNLAAYLNVIRNLTPSDYDRIRDVVRLAAPFFDDFKLRPMPTNRELIQLEWVQRDSDYPFLPSQLSDGTLRFACLATALLPQYMSVRGNTLLFDEPEIGLHPYALTLLADLFQQAVRSQQVVVATHSAMLLNELAPEDVVIVERTEGESIFQRLDSARLSEWLQEYTLGDLWQKNVLGGNPRNEGSPSPPDDDASPITARNAPGSGDASS